jgi:exodeoxyribonuclease VII small subunit
MATKNPTFEESLSRLDEIVKSLEKGDKSLDDALTLFEEGTALVKSCGKMLDTAEQKVVKLQKGSDGEPVETTFDTVDV